MRTSTRRNGWSITAMAFAIGDGIAMSAAIWALTSGSAWLRYTEIAVVVFAVATAVAALPTHLDLRGRALTSENVGGEG